MISTERVDIVPLPRVVEDKEAIRFVAGTAVLGALALAATALTGKKIVQSLQHHRENRQ